VSFVAPGISSGENSSKSRNTPNPPSNGMQLFVLIKTLVVSESHLHSNSNYIFAISLLLAYFLTAPKTAKIQLYSSEVTKRMAFHQR
jgi:hypothetical protein